MDPYPIPTPTRPPVPVAVSETLNQAVGLDPSMQLAILFFLIALALVSTMVYTYTK